MKTWEFDSPGWWIDAIYRSCCPISRSERYIVTPDECGNFLDGLTAAYGSTLDLLRRPGLTNEQAEASLFRAKALRKWRLADPAKSLERKEKALLGFLHRNEVARDSGPIDYPYGQLMKALLSKWLPLTTGDCTGRFGPGAVAEKWTHPMRFEHLAWWSCVDQQWPDYPLKDIDSQSVNARLCAVPKDYSKDRLITVEPCYNSFVQQYVRQVLQSSIHAGPLRGSCMDLEYTDGQAIQRRLAQQASKNKRLATLDLSDASDGISWDQVRQVFPGWVCALLDVTRSETFSTDRAVPGYPDARQRIPMWIYAGMGNGTTFTVETLFFSAYVKAFAFAHGLPTFVSVFGDDIICHSETAKRLVMEGQRPFFQINAAKSFIGDDCLRESCGIFAYQGADITAPRIDGYPATLEGRFGVADLHRRLRQKEARFPGYGILANLICRCGHLPNWDVRFDGYPSLDNPNVERSAYAMPMRWNTCYQRFEAKLPVREARTRSYPTDDTVARRFNQPPAYGWYLAHLCGMIGATDFRVRTGQESRRMSITIPVKDSWRCAKRWITPTDSSTADSSLETGRTSAAEFLGRQCVNNRTPPVREDLIDTSRTVYRCKLIRHGNHK